MGANPHGGVHGVILWWFKHMRNKAFWDTHGLIRSHTYFVGWARGRQLLTALVDQRVPTKAMYIEYPSHARPKAQADRPTFIMNCHGVLAQNPTRNGFVKRNTFPYLDEKIKRLVPSRAVLQSHLQEWCWRVIPWVVL